MNNRRDSKKLENKQKKNLILKFQDKVNNIAQHILFSLMNVKYSDQKQNNLDIESLEGLKKYREELHRERNEISEEVRDLERPMYFDNIDNQHQIDTRNIEIALINKILIDVNEKINLLEKMNKNKEASLC